MPKKNKVHLYEGGRHVLTDGININQKIHFIMKKKVKLVSKLEDKALVKKAIKTSECGVKCLFALFFEPLGSSLPPQVRGWQCADCA